MGRHTGDYLLGTCFLAAALLLDLSNLASQRVLDPPGQASSVNPTVHFSELNATTALRYQPAITQKSKARVCCVLKNLSRGTRIVVGSVDVSGGRHAFNVTVGGNHFAPIDSLPVTRFTLSAIRRRENGKNPILPILCGMVPQTVLPLGVARNDGPHESAGRIFLTPHFMDTGAVHEPTECRFIGQSPRVRVFLDERLAQSSSGGQILTWAECLTYAAESRALPLVDAWLGGIRDIDHDHKLSIVVTDLDRRGRYASESAPIHGCIRESDFSSESDFYGDIVYVDHTICGLPTNELAALLTHETTHAAVCSTRLDDTTHFSQTGKSSHACKDLHVPAWLNEAVAHFVELQCAATDVHAVGVSLNFQRRMDDFFANPAASPIVAAEDVLNLEERRGGSRGAATLFLARWFSSTETLQQFVSSQAAFERRIEDLTAEPFVDVFRDWTLSLAAMSALPTLQTLPESKTPMCDQRRLLHYDLLPAPGIPVGFSLLGTAFRCFECTEDIAFLLLESDDAAKLQISIIEPEMDISTITTGVASHF